MAVLLGIAGQNLSIKAISGSENEKQDKQRIIDGFKGFSKIPIYKGSNFLHWEIPKDAIPRVFEVWKESEIVIDKRAQPFVDAFRFNSIPIKDLFNEEITINPANPEYEYSDHQAEFISIDHAKTALALFLDTGAGKTLALLGRAANMGFKRILVLTILDNFSDWEAHCRIMFGDTKSVAVYDGSKAKRLKIDTNSDIIISNYEKMKAIKDLDIDYDLIIFDEFHCITNPTSKGFKLAVALAKKAAIKLGSTATPLENELDPLWGALHILNPLIAGSKEKFLDKFQEVVRFKEVTYTRHGREMTFKVPIELKTKNVDILKKLLATIMYRVDTAKAFKFKDETEIIEVEITKRQKELYDMMVEEILFELSARTFWTDDPLQKTLRLLQIADGVYNLEPDNLESGKLDLYRKEFEKASDKVVYWSRFKESTNILGRLFPDKCVVFNGDTSKPRKKLGKWAFQGCRDKEEEAEFYRLLEKYPDYPFKQPGSAQFFSATFNQRSGAGMNLSSCAKQIVGCIGESGRALKQATGRIKRTDSKHPVINSSIVITRGTLEGGHTKKVLAKIQKCSNILDGTDSILNTKLSEIIGLISNPRINELG